MNANVLLSVLHQLSIDFFPRAAVVPLSADRFDKVITYQYKLVSAILLENGKTILGTNICSLVSLNDNFFIRLR